MSWLKAVLVCVSGVVWLQVSVVDGQTPPTPNRPTTLQDDVQIAALIQQLGGENYQQRVRAERELESTGMASVRFLVEQIVAGPPETAARSIRILRKIGVAANQSDMTRVTRILQLLSQNGFQHLAQSSTDMATRWKQAQIELTTQQIRDCGIEFISVDNEFAGVFVGGGRLDPESPSSPISVDQPSGFDRTERTPDQLLESVDAILAASDADVQNELAEAIADSSGTRSQAGRANSGHGIAVVIDGRVVQLEGGASAYYSATITPDTIDVAKGLRLMRMLPSMPHIEFRERDIGESEIQALQNLPGLRALTLTRCRYDPAPLLDYIKRHPGINVTAAGHDAFLGVSLQTLPHVDGDNPFGSGEPETQGVCRVITVVENTAAAEAGIQEGDAILEIGEYPISTFSELVVIIASRSPGDSIKLKILHNGEMREETVTLRKRPLGQ